jgi:hypothetical protein
MNLNMIAETAPTAGQMNGFFTVLSWASFVVMNIVTVVVMSRKQKREVYFGFEPASKEEFQKSQEENDREHRELFSKIGGVERGQIARLDIKFAELARDAHEGRDKLHDRINQVLSAVSRMEGEIKTRRRE